MTDKQIIIDGVDVSGCVQFIQDEKDCCDLGGSCKGWDNCYYKQLKRKEQECERLNKIIDEAKNSKLDLKSFLVGEAVQNEYEQQLDQLKAENEWVKSHFKQIDETNKILYQEKCELLSKLDGWDEVYKEVNDIAYVISLKMNKYKQALTEIKQIAEKDFNHTCWQTYEKQLKQILEKCEVIDEI